MNIQDQINELQKQLDALKAEAAKQDNAWPKDGDKYFTIYSDSSIGEPRWNSDSADSSVKKRGLIFRTREEAERYDKRRILIASIREFAGYYNFVYDRTWHHYIYFNAIVERWDVDMTQHADQLPICGYFKDEATARACIEKFKDELHLLRKV